MDEADFSHPLSDQERQALVDAYDNCLASLDDQVGKLLTFLASRPEWSNTIVIITSDHGEAFGEHGAYNHGWNLYRETVHVPLVIFGPGVPAGTRLTDTVPVRKLFPTVLDLTLGEKLPFSRVSLRRFWTPGFRPEPFDETAISELISRKAGVPGYISLTTPEWQYIEDSQGRKELYQWATSPEERVNLAESNPQKAHELESSLRQSIASSLRPWVEPRYLLALGPGGGLLQAERLAGGDHGHDAQAVEAGAADRAGFHLPGEHGVLAGQAGVGVGEARAGEHVAGPGLQVLAADLVGRAGGGRQQGRQQQGIHQEFGICDTHG